MKMILNPIETLVYFPIKWAIICATLIALLSGCDERADSGMPEHILANGNPLFSLTYNEYFARRFGLPETDATRQTSGLYAMAAEINRTNGRYFCSLHLYVDAELDLYIPDNGMFFFEKPMAEYFFIDEYNDEDQAWNSQQLNKNLMRILFRSTSLKNSDTGMSSTLQYSRIHRTFLPGISLYSVDFPCLLFERENHPAELLIQKQDTNGYLLGNENPQNIQFEEKSYLFSIPISLIDDIQPHINTVIKQNLKTSQIQP